MSRCNEKTILKYAHIVYSKIQKMFTCVSNNASILSKTTYNSWITMLALLISKVLTIINGALSDPRTKI